MLRLFGAVAATVVFSLSVSAVASESVLVPTSAELSELKVASQILGHEPSGTDPVVTSSLTPVEAVPGESSPAGVAILLGAAFLGLGFLGRSRPSVA